MPRNVTARTTPLNAVQNHSEPGPMNAIPSVLMSFTPAPSVLLPRWADDTREARARRGFAWDEGRPCTSLRLSLSQDVLTSAWDVPPDGCQVQSGGDRDSLVPTPRATREAQRVISKSVQSIVGIVFGFAIGGLIGFFATPAAPPPSAVQGVFIAAVDRSEPQPAPVALALEEAVALAPASPDASTPSPTKAPASTKPA